MNRITAHTVCCFSSSDALPFGWGGYACALTSVLLHTYTKPSAGANQASAEGFAAFMAYGMQGNS